MGFVKHAFVLSMYCLCRAAEKPVDQLYDWVMFQVTRLQGDTDTNCAIVGGIAGAYVGVDKIDRHKLRTLLKCRIDKARAVSSPMGGA